MKQTFGCALAAICTLASGFAAPQTRAARLYNQVPLGFEANQGETNHQVKFLARAPGYTLFLTRVTLHGKSHLPIFRIPNGLDQIGPLGRFGLVEKTLMDNVVPLVGPKKAGAPSSWSSLTVPFVTGACL